MQADFYTAGELVVMKLGDFALSMHFADALRVSYLLLQSGRAARRTHLGGMAKLLPSFRTMGVLSDASAEASKPSRWAQKPPEIFKGSEIAVREIGVQVQISFRRTVATISWDAALTFAQHLRVRGKEAKNSINEKETWYKLAGGATAGDHH